MKALTHLMNLSEKDGFALIVTILVVLVVSALTTGAVLVGGNHILANRYYERANQLQIAANSGVRPDRHDPGTATETRSRASGGGSMWVPPA